MKKMSEYTNAERFAFVKEIFGESWKPDKESEQRVVVKIPKRKVETLEDLMNKKDLKGVVKSIINEYNKHFDDCNVWDELETYEKIQQIENKTSMEFVIENFKALRTGYLI